MPRGVTLFDEHLIQGRVDSDALTYINKVERTDGASLEPGIKVAINNFVVNCKAGGLWDKLSIVGIFAGARSIEGALLTLKGPMESFDNFGFLQSDYDRRNGIAGDDTAKYLGTSPYFATSEALDDYHIAFSLTTLDTTATASPVYGFGGTVYDTAATHNTRVTSRNSSLVNVGSSRFGVGFSCVSRDNSSNFDWRNSKTTTNYTHASINANNAAFRILRSGSVYTTNVMNYWAGGKAIAAMGLYDDLVTTLLADIARAVN